MESKKVILVEIAGKGGICHYTYNLAQALSKSRTVVVATAIDYELANKVRDFELVGIFNRFRTSIFKIYRLLRLCDDKTIDAVHMQLSQHPGFVLWLCLLMKALVGKKIIVTAHNVVSHETKATELLIYYCLYHVVDHIIVHAEANKDEMQKMFKVKKEKIFVIVHGNYMFFNEEKVKPPIAKDTATVLFFGYIRPYKGLIYLIRALRFMKDKIPNVKLIIAGKPIEDFTPYAELIAKLQLSECVETHLDYINFDQVKEFFLKANVVVLPYENVYQSGVIQLAYGFGRPVVVTEVGGMPEAVEDGESGFIIPPKDTASLNKATSYILTNLDFQQKLSDRAWQLAQTKFSWETIAVKTQEVYHNLNKAMSPGHQSHV